MTTLRETFEKEIKFENYNPNKINKCIEEESVVKSGYRNNKEAA